MLELLKLRIDGFGVGESSINIWTQNGRLRYSYDRSPLDTDPSIIVKVPKSIADDFLSKLQDIHVYRWKDHYEKETAETGKHFSHMKAHWGLIYKEVGGETLSFSGNDAYPKNWKTFMDLINNLVNESQSMHLNGLSHMDIDFHDTHILEGYDAISQKPVKKAVPYRETLSLDRKEGMLRYVQFPNDHTSVKHEYSVPEIIDYLLGNCERYFHDFEKRPYEHVNHRQASISVHLFYRNGRNVSFTRTYDRSGIPDDWHELLDDLHDTMAFFGLYGPLFDENLYKHGVKNGEFIYLFVSDTRGRSHYFRTLDDTLNVGDLVIIPDRNISRKKIAMISEIVYCTADNVPCPLNETGFIIGRYRPRDTFGPDYEDDDYDPYDDLDDDDF